MKKRLSIIGGACVAVALCFSVQSCMQTDAENPQEQSVSLSEADLLVASPEFQAYMRALNSHTQYISIGYQKLSQIDKAKFDELLTAHENDPSGDWLTEAGQMLMYNLKGGNELVEDLRSQVDFPEGITQEEILRAVERNKHLMITTTRMSYPGESNTGPRYISDDLPDMRGQRGDDCVPSSMSYINNAYGGDMSRRDFNSQYEASYGENPYDSGVNANNYSTYVDQNFYTTPFTSFDDAINNGHYTMIQTESGRYTVTDTNGVTQTYITTHAVVVVGIRSDGQLIVKDPLNPRREGSIDPKDVLPEYTKVITGNK